MQFKKDSTILDRYSFVASGFSPLLDPHDKLETDSKSCTLQVLAVNDARQRLDTFLRSGKQQMLPRSAVPVSLDACASRTHILSDRPHIKLRFVQAQKLYRHRSRSALLISATKCMHEYMHICFLSVL
jgi:hypothetical protein